MNRKSAAVLLVVSLAVLAVVLLPAASLGAKGGNSGNPNRGGGGGSSSLTLRMVNDVNHNGSPNWGDSVTFDVSTTDTAYPTVQLDCYQNGVHVYWASAGFYDSYPWQWARNFTLRSDYWTGGGADCTAALNYTTSNGRTRTLATLAFRADG